MKRLLPAFALVCLISVQSIAGDTNGPGAVASPTPPPTCTENCTSSSTTTQSLSDELLEVAVTLLLIVVAG